MKPIAFGRYTLLRRLARGGMAELFLARSSGPAGVERLVVVKLVATRLTHDAALMEMFADEARIAATLDHPNIGQVLDVGEVDGQYYLAMEYLHGKDLRTVLGARTELGRPCLPPDIVTYLGTRLCAALHCAHEATGIDGQPLEIIHRDVSPSNVMLTFHGSVKLLDFGIAKAANRLSLTRPGCIKGKVRYLSPEQLLGEGIDRRSDIFTLGIVLWEMVCGRHLFDGDQEFQIFEAISQGVIPPPRQLTPDCPEELEQVLMKALAREPAQRYASALQMHLDLERFARGSGITLSDLRIVELMHETFGEEIARWEQARQAGTGLLNYLLQTADGDEETEDEQEPLSQSDNRRTTAPTTARGRRPSTGQHHPAEPAMEQAHTPESLSTPQGERDKPSPKKTRIFSGQTTETKAPPAAVDGPRKTVMYGSLAAARQVAAVAATPANRPDPTPLRVAELRQVAITPDGGVRAGDLNAAAASPADGVDEVWDAARPTMLGEGSSAVMFALDEGVGSPLPNSHTVEPRRAAASSSIPLRGADEGTHTAAAGHDDGVTHTTTRRKRPRTGDWAHQASAAELQRPGTHPYFAQQRPTIYGELPNSEPGQQRAHRRWLLVTIVACLAGGAIVASLGLLRGPKPAQQVRPTGSHSGATLTVTSDPSGATVFSAVTGQELGKTPLDLPRETMQGQRVELHMGGYEVASLTLDRAHGTHHVQLRRTPASPASQRSP